MYKAYTHCSDREIWAAFRSGSEEAYSYMYSHFVSILFRYGTKLSSDRELVKDAIQDMFVYLWASKHKLSPTDSIKYYLFRVLRRGILAQKQLAIQASSAFWVEILLAESNPSVEQELIEQQQDQAKKQRLADGIGQLPLRQKEAVFLRFYENLAYAQIAEIMSISPRAVYKLIYKAIDALQKNMLPALAGLLLRCAFLELPMA